MTWKNENRLVIADQKFASEDMLHIYDADTGRLLFIGREPKLDGLSKLLRTIGGRYGQMAGTEYALREAESGAPVARVSRQGRMIGRPPPFEIYDGAEALLARLIPHGNRWRFLDNRDAKLCDLALKRRGGFAWSVTSLAHDILVEGVPFASVAPYRDAQGRKYEGKRLRLLEFAAGTEQETTVRLLLLAIGVSVERILNKAGH